MRGHPYWQWLENSLRAESRAIGGEPCRICTRSIEASAPWQYRDRHVCSGQCNGLLRSQFDSKVRQGEVPRYRAPEDYRATLRRERDREPQFYRTDLSAEFPYEHGRWPVLGDVIERHGQLSVYMPLGALPYVHPLITGVMRENSIPENNAYAVLHANSGAYTAWFTRASGRPRRSKMEKVFVGMEVIADCSKAFHSGGRNMYCEIERITDVDEHGWEFTWEATVFTPVQLHTSLWAPGRQKLSEKRSRVSRAKSAYLARIRALGLVGDAEGVDPWEVYEGDDWICGLCGGEVDPKLEWPDPYCATLDHIRPVTRLGAHSMGNLQTAHWICNLRKGNRS